MVLMRGMIGMSNVPFGDLSVSVEPSDANVAAFRLSNSIFFFLLTLLSSVCSKNPLKISVGTVEGSFDFLSDSHLWAAIEVGRDPLIVGLDIWASVLVVVLI